MGFQASDTLAARIRHILQLEFDDLPCLIAIILDSEYADYATRISPIDPDGFLRYTWEALIRLAGQSDRSGNEHSKLAEIMRWLGRLPRRPIPNNTVWEGLRWIDPYIPSFHEGQFYHPTVCYAPGRSFINITGLTSPGVLSDEAEFQKYLNIHAFAALLTGLGLVRVPYQAISAIAQVAEGVVFQEEDGGKAISSEDPLDTEHLDMKTTVAAIWIKHGGHVLYHFAVQDDVSEGGPVWERIYRVAKEEEKSIQGLHRWRWDVWVRRFDEISDDENVSQRTCSLAGEIFNELLDIRDEHGF